MTVLSWQQISQAKKDHRDRSIAQIQPSLPKLPSNLPTSVVQVPSQVLSEEENAITTKAPESLVLKLASGFWTSEQVTRAFLRRAAIAQELVFTVPYEASLHLRY